MAENKPTPFNEDDLREGLRLEREASAARMAQQVTQANLDQYIGHMRALYGVPDGWQMRNWMVGFEHVEEQDHGHSHD